MPEYGGTSISDLIGRPDTQNKAVYSESEYDSLFNDDNQDQNDVEFDDGFGDDHEIQPAEMSPNQTFGGADGDFAPVGDVADFQNERRSHLSSQPRHPSLPSGHLSLPTDNEARHRNDRRYVTVTNQRMEDDGQIQRLIDPQTKDLANRINSKLRITQKSDETNDRLSEFDLPDLVDTDDEGDKSIRTTPNSLPMTSNRNYTALSAEMDPYIGDELGDEVGEEANNEAGEEANNEAGEEVDNEADNELGGGGSCSSKKKSTFIIQNRGKIGALIGALFLLIMNLVRSRRRVARTQNALSQVVAGVDPTGLTAPDSKRMKIALSTRRSGLLTLLLISLFCGVIYVVVRYAIK